MYMAKILQMKRILSLCLIICHDCSFLVSMARSFANGVYSLFKSEADLCPIDPWYTALTSFEFVDPSKLSQDASRIKKTCLTLRSVTKSNMYSVSARLILTSFGDEIEKLAGFRLPQSEILYLVLNSAIGIAQIIDFPRILVVEMAGRTKDRDLFKNEVHIRKQVLKLRSTIQSDGTQSWAHFLGDASNQDTHQLMSNPIDDDTIFLLYESLDDPDDLHHEKARLELEDARETVNGLIQEHIKRSKDEQNDRNSEILACIEEELSGLTLVTSEARTQVEKDCQDGKYYSASVQSEYLPTILKMRDEHVSRSLAYFDDLKNWYAESNSIDFPIDKQIEKIRFLILSLSKSTINIDDTFHKSSGPKTFVNEDGSCFLNFGVTALLQTPRLEVYMRSINEKKHKEFKNALSNLLSLTSKGEKVSTLVEFRRALGENFEYSMGGTADSALRQIFKMIPSLDADTLFLKYDPFDRALGYLRGRTDSGIKRKHMKQIAVAKFVKKASALYQNQSFIVVTLPHYVKITDYPFELRLKNPEKSDEYVVFDLKITSFMTKTHGVSRVLIDNAWFQVDNHKSFLVSSDRRSAKKTLFKQGTTGLVYHKRKI